MLSQLGARFRDSDSGLGLGIESFFLKDPKEADSDSGITASVNDRDLESDNIHYTVSNIIQRQGLGIVQHNLIRTRKWTTDINRDLESASDTKY